MINAYRGSAAEALAAAEKNERIIEDVYELTFEYATMSEVMNAVKKNKVEVVLQDFGNISKLQIAIRQSEVEATMRQLRANIAKVRIEEIDAIESIEHLEIDFIQTR